MTRESDPQAPPHLFNHGEFQLHSGSTSPFKINCDALTEDDLDALALIVAAQFRYRSVLGIPRGGTRFADALRRWEVPSIALPRLLVDDVWTTGSSMTNERSRNVFQMAETIGVVIVARGPTPSWVHPLFRTWEARDE